MPYSNYYPCSIEGCDRPRKNRGMCGTHFMRVRRTGSTGTAEIVSPGLGLAERFWSKVDRRGPDECWPWTGALNEHGYGVMRPEGRRSGPTVKAHRVSMQLDGRDPGGAFVLHSCDNPICVNPAHLRAGTHLDNCGDAVKRDRVAFGERRPQSKLTEQQVREILSRRASGETYKSIAADYPVSVGAIGHICRGSTWRRTSNAVTPPAARDIVGAVAAALA